jgi:hypothetical protein
VIGFRTAFTWLVTHIGVTFLTEFCHFHTSFKDVGTGLTGLEKMSILLSNETLSCEFHGNTAVDTQIFLLGPLGPPSLEPDLTIIADTLT